MNDFHVAAVNQVAARWAAAMWAMSWQFCVLGAAVLLIQWSLRRAAPNWRYWLWQILAIKLLLMPFWTVALPWTASALDTPAITPASSLQSAETTGRNGQSVLPANERSNVSTQLTPRTSRETTEGHALGSPQTIKTAATEATGDKVSKLPDFAAANPESGENTSAGVKAVPDIPSQRSAESAVQDTRRSATLEADAHEGPAFSWPAGLMFAWITGVVWSAGRIVRQGLALQQRLRQTTPANAALVERVRQAALRVGTHSIPDVRVVDLDTSPFVCGLWRPRLIVSRGLTESFTAEQLDLVLLHELAHIQRRDLIWGWIPEIGKVLFFFHPVIHFLCYQIRFERELACDQIAMTASGRDAATYADTLVRVAGQYSTADSFQLAAVKSSQG